MPDHIDPKTIDAFAKPEAHHVMDSLAHVWIAPIQIRLLGEKRVIIILPGRRIVFPSTAAEFRQPVVRWPAIQARLTPNIPVAPRIVAQTPAFDEPGMLIGGM